LSPNKDDCNVTTTAIRDPFKPMKRRTTQPAITATTTTFIKHVTSSNGFSRKIVSQPHDTGRIHSAHVLSQQNHPPLLDSRTLARWCVGLNWKPSACHPPLQPYPKSMRRTRAFSISVPPFRVFYDARQRRQKSPYFTEIGKI
jgi:hypothetical protein